MADLFEEIFWKHICCVVGKLWLKFRDFWRSFDRVLDFYSLLTKADFCAVGSSDVTSEVPKGKLLKQQRTPVGRSPILLMGIRSSDRGSELLTGAF